VFAGGVILGALVWFAPTIILNSPLKNTLIATAAGDFQGAIQVGSVSAGWLSPLSARGVVVYDAAGERLAEAASVVVDKSLVSLLRNYRDLGTIRVQSPVVNLVLRPDGSNLEDALAPWLAPSEEPSAEIGCVVEIQQGLIEVTDVAARRVWSAENLALTLDLPRDAASPLTLHMQTDVNPRTGVAGVLATELLWQRGDAAALAGKGNVSLTARALPIELSTPLVHRFASDLSLAGLLDGDVKVGWGETGETLRMDALTVQGLALAAPRWLGPDQIRLQSVRAAGEVERRGTSWQIQPTVIESDLGKLQLRGGAVVSGQAPTGAMQGVLEALRHGRFTLDGHVDLARIAAMLPNTLHIRPGTHVATGQIAMGFRSESTAQGLRWDSRVAASDLSAMYEGRRITWEQPIVLSMSAREANQEIVFENVACESSFLQVNAQGSSTQGTATLQGDLSQLVSELSRFVDLGEINMAGRLQAQANWQPAGANRIKIDASGTAEQFQLVSASQLPWREDRLAVTLSGTGAWEALDWRAVEQASLHVESGQDVLDVHVLPSPTGSVRDQDWPVRVSLTGELSSWLARVQPFVSLSDWQISGAAKMTAEGAASTNHLLISKADVQVKELRASNGSLFLNEPAVQVTAAGAWRRQDQAFTASEATLASSSLAFRAQDVLARPTAAGWQLAGNVHYRGDVGKVAAWFHDPQQPATQTFAGQAAGQVQLNVDNGITAGQFSADVSDFTYQTRNGASANTSGNAAEAAWNTVWQEPRIKLATSFTHDPQADEVRFARLEAAGETVSLAAQGKLSQPATRCFAELEGQLAYDLQKVSTRLRSRLGDNVQLAGQGTRPFSFRGPLISAAADAPPSSQLHPVSIDPRQPPATTATMSALAEMLAQASLGWTSAAVHGFDVGAGELDAKLAEGRLSIAPLDLPVSDGRVRLTPELQLNRSPQLLTLAPGQVIEQVRISPQMCSTWLKYIAPLVADAAAAEGRFSVALQKAVIPLSGPNSGDVEGVLEVHQAQIGPGPLSQQLLMLAAQIRALAEGRVWDGRGLLDEQWLQLPAQRVAFRLAENRVYHQGLELAVKDVVMRTSGSVGTDQTLSMVAEIPIREEWLGTNRYLQSLRGENLQIPIHGTLSQPRLDQRALQQITQQTVTGAATRVLQDEANRQLKRGLEKLFGPPQPAPQ